MICNKNCWQNIHEQKKRDFIGNRRRDYGVLYFSSLDVILV